METLDGVVEAELLQHEAEALADGAATRFEGVDIKELVQLCAVDTLLFEKTFFPKTFRQEFAPFHRVMTKALDAPQIPFVDFACFRGSAKTTHLRAFSAKRIAFGISRTILYVSAAQNHSISSLDWIKKQIELNAPFAKTFGLKKGRVWNAEKSEIIHEIEGCSIWILALGITGQTRGINLDDYRPDLIIVDDPCDEENTNTPEQRAKISNLFFGSLQNSLAPVSECPDAKMVLAQTMLHPDDLVNLCIRDSQWKDFTFSCFDEEGHSAWPARWTTEELNEKKKGFISRNQLSLWTREMECRIVGSELSDFKAEWLQFYRTLPENLVVYIGIDPASSEAKTADQQVISVIGFAEGKVYLLEYIAARGRNPEETASDFFRLVLKWRPLAAAVESIAYQRVLAWYLRKEMHKHNIFVPIVEVQDKRKKRDRIRQGFAGLASQGRFFVREEHTEFIQQFVDYPNVKHDDILDGTEIAMQAASTELLLDTSGKVAASYGEDNVVSIRNWRSAP